MPEPREVMNTRQLSEYLGFSYGTLRNTLSNNENSLPPYINIGGQKRWYLATVRTWLENNTGSDSLQRKSTSSLKVEQ